MANTQNMDRLAVRCIAWLGLGEDGIDVRDKPGREANVFVNAPPSSSTRRSKQAVQESPARRFKSPFRKDTPLRPFPNVEGCPGILLQHLLQPELIGGIESTLSMEPTGHQFGNVPVLGDGHADHRPLRHCRIMLVTLKRPRVLSDLQTDKDQRYNHANRRNDLRQIGYLFDRHKF